jgi:hypothetical protein
MNRNYINTHLVVDRYLRGELTEEEIALFEERLVWDQALMDEVDLAQKLRAGIRSVLETDESAEFRHGGMVDRVVSLFSVPAYAAAASFLLAVGMTSVLLTGNSPTGNSLPTAGQLATEIVPLYATRSTDAVAMTVSEDAWRVLLLDAPAGYTMFRASVRRREDGDEVLWSRDDMLPTYLESLAVGMPGRILEEGAYVLILDGKAEGATAYTRIQEIAFVVTQSQ